MYVSWFLWIQILIAIPQHIRATSKLTVDQFYFIPQKSNIVWVFIDYFSLVTLWSIKPLFWIWQWLILYRKHDKILCNKFPFHYEILHNEETLCEIMQNSRMEWKLIAQYFIMLPIYVTLYLSYSLPVLLYTSVT